jgi:hypothetical protein
MECIISRCPARRYDVVAILEDAVGAYRLAASSHEKKAAGFERAKPAA